MAEQDITSKLEAMNRISELVRQRDDLLAALGKTTKYLEIRTKKQSKYSIPRYVDKIIEDNKAAIAKAQPE